MYIEFSTTITHRITLGDEGIESIDHTVEIDAGEAVALGQHGVMLIAAGGCKAALNSIEGGKKPTIVEVPDEEDQP